MDSVLTKKNQIVDCPDAEALAAFKHNIRDEWLARHLGQEKPKSMAALTTLMTRFCASEDSWLARSRTTPRNSGTLDIRDSNGKPRRNRHKHRNNGDNTEDTTVNAGSAAPSPVSGKSYSKETTQDRPVWTAYLISHVKLTGPPINQPTRPRQNCGCLNRPAS